MIGILARGTKEQVFVDITDSQSVITDLSSSTPQFDIETIDGTVKVSAQSATASGMRITCLLDLSNTTTYPAGEYNLFVKFTVGAQVIVKGPFYFAIAG